MNSAMGGGDDVIEGLARLVDIQPAGGQPVERRIGIGRHRRERLLDLMSDRGRKLAGRSENNRVVNFAGPSRLVGHFVDLEITHALPHSLRGRVVTVPQEETAA